MQGGESTVARDDQQIADLAGAYGATTEALLALLASLRDQAGADYFYIYWTTGAAGKPAGAPRQRTLLVFPTADAALAFAQRNQLHVAERPRLRRLSLLQLVQATLREPSITAILFAADQGESHQPGHLPPGARVERASLLRSLHPDG
jgi:hypothetical protein